MGLSDLNQMPALSLSLQLPVIEFKKRVSKCYTIMSGNVSNLVLLYLRYRT